MVERLAKIVVFSAVPAIPGAGITPIPLGESGPCWNAGFTADRCCQGPRPGDTTCWDGKEYNYRDCCDVESKAAADAVAYRWDALLNPNGGDLDSCMHDVRALGLANFLRSFAIQEFRWTQENETKTRRDRRHQRRLGRSGRAYRCNKRKSVHPQSVRLLRKLRSSDVALTDWIVNFGAGGWDDPMYPLTFLNVSALFVDPLGARETTYGPNVRFVSAAANPVNICEILEQGGIPILCGATQQLLVQIDFLKVDIDSFDCGLVDAALRYVRPKIIWVEINLSFPPPFRFTRHWHPSWFDSWLNTLHGGRVLATHGCSLSAAVALMRESGFSLYGLDTSDAIFVSNDVADLVGGADLDEFLCYQDATGQGVTYVKKGWIHEWAAGDEFDVLRRMWCNLTIHDRLFGVSSAPFTLGF